MGLPGVVPESAKFLGGEAEDKDGNQLWRVTLMKDSAIEYSRLLKKNGYHNHLFNFDKEQYGENQKLKAQLEQDMTTLN